jgi:hypothetical protein
MSKGALRLRGNNKQAVHRESQEDLEYPSLSGVIRTARTGAHSL